MRIGTIAQHANIGPTSPASISKFTNKIPGRLNDFDIFAWWDFTDPIAVGGGTEAQGATENLQQCDDKGPNNVGLAADSSTKGPTYVHDGDSGQDNYPHIKLASDANDSLDFMDFVNPQSVSSRKFTATIIFDMNSAILNEDNYFFKLRGGSNSSLSFYWYKILGTPFVALQKTGHTSRFAYATGPFDGIYFLAGSTGGDFNYKFNWITLVLEADGTMKMYMRGVPLTMFQSGTFSDTDIASQFFTSELFTNQSVTASQSSVDAARQLGASVYEVMMFNESLSHQQLHSIDMYIKNKYKNYQFGRVNGF